MLVLISYDVNTEDPAGKKRLRKIAKQCVNYGQRVQCSVFECLLDAAQCKMLQAKLLAIIDPAKDSLRFYYLGQKYESKIEITIMVKIIRTTYFPSHFLIKYKHNTVIQSGINPGIILSSMVCS